METPRRLPRSLLDCDLDLGVKEPSRRKEREEAGRMVQAEGTAYERRSFLRATFYQRLAVPLKPGGAQRGLLTLAHWQLLPKALEATE